MIETGSNPMAMRSSSSNSTAVERILSSSKVSCSRMVVARAVQLPCMNRWRCLDVFSFESARHTDYPFALACYINSNVYNRLSVCCEARCKGFVRIGGRYGVFGIIDVQKERSCRRCRYEQRMNKLLEADGKPVGFSSFVEPSSVTSVYRR